MSEAQVEEEPAEQHRLPVPVAVWRGLSQVARGLDVSPEHLARTAWVKVRAVLTGEPELPPGPWSALVAGSGGDPRECSIEVIGDSAWLVIRHRSALLSAVDASRVGEYVVGVLRALVEQPHARHEQHSLLSGKDLWRQLNVLHGEIRELPDRRAHEIFEDQVRRTPDAVAAVLADEQWTYAELNRRANAVAHRLIAAGAQPQDVIAVLSERTLPWVAAIIGILKAGLVYLPVDPAFPDHRIAGMLGRSGARLVLSGVPARQVVGQTPVLPLDAGSDVDTDPGVPVAPGSAAYIYFTSGSTGEPKGAVCEHAGMLNHLMAKIDDLALGPGDVVCQNAPQCFDISLWQVLAPLLAGGRTVLVPSHVILDVAAFLDTLGRERVTVLQLVPSYLEVLLAHLDEHPERVPGLRIVCVTGEAIARRLVVRWFDRFAAVPLVNAYGATEVSDDTTHEIMRAAPPTDLVPVGRPVQNVSVYILDSQDGLVPFGAPGQVAFAGVSVGPGYINDPERTSEAFAEDPFRPGQRMYRTGDYGRWLPNGHLEFLGRRDEQVKISGMRVEVGEVENHVLRMPGVRSACVVVVPIGQSKRLAAFFTATEPMPELKQRLADVLPVHMVPATVRQLDSLPLTENGKVNKSALLALALRAVPQRSTRQGSSTAPSTPLQRRLATAWSEVLNRPLEDIFITDNFFDLGGNSLAAVRLIVKLDQLISLTDLTSKPVLADLAEVALASRRAQVLQPLAIVGDQVASVVAVPDAAGTALNFQPLAAGLSDHGCSLYAVELPGHDLARPDEPVAGVRQIASQLAEEIIDATSGPVVLWGHGSGTAITLETARLLVARQRPPMHILLAAAVADPDLQDRAVATTRVMRGGDVRRHLAAHAGYTELDEFKNEREALIERAYRHDVISAGMFLRDAPSWWSEPLPVPTDVVFGEHDPLLTELQHPDASWHRFLPSARLRIIPGAGRYFLRSHLSEVADTMLSVLPVRARA